MSRLERRLVRPIVVFTTFLLCLFASVQLLGRVAVTFVPHFQDQVNDLLAERRIRIQGLDAHWQGFDPVFTVSSIEFPAGNVDRVSVQVDLLESVWRNALIPAQVRIPNAQVHVERTLDGWQLLGMSGDPIDFDVVPVLNHGDDLHGQVRLVVHDTSPEVEFFDVELAGANTGRQHFLSVAVASVEPDGGASAEDAKLDLRFWRHKAGWFESGDGNLLQAHGELRLPRAVVGVAGARLQVNQFEWRDGVLFGDENGGRLVGSVLGVRPKDAAHSLNLVFAVDAVPSDDGVNGLVSTLRLEVAQEVHDLPPIHLRWQGPQDEASALDTVEELLNPDRMQPMLSAWVEEIQFDGITQLAQAYLQDWGVAGRWMNALAVKGHARDVHGYFDPTLGVGYIASIEGLSMQGFKGAPRIERGFGRVWGYDQGVAFNLDAPDVTLQFPDLFHNSWEAEGVAGTAKGWFGGGYFALRSERLQARIGGTQVEGSFAVTRPSDRFEQRVSVVLAVDRSELEQARTFIPYKIPQQLEDWLAIGPHAGVLTDATFAYHGHVRLRPNELHARRIELRTHLEEGEVTYVEGWPRLDAVIGDIHVAGAKTQIEIRSAQSLGIDIGQSRAVLHDNATYASVALSGSAQGDQMLELIRQSPLQETMAFVDSEWRSSGMIDFEGTLVVPLKSADSPGNQPLTADFEFDLAGLDLAMPNYRMQVDDLIGRGTFSLPHMLNGSFSGRLFGRDAQIVARAQPRWLSFDAQASATPEDVYRLIAFDGEAPVTGEFEFAGTLNLAMNNANNASVDSTSTQRGNLAVGRAIGSKGVSNFTATTDLIGLNVQLPGRFGKAVDLSSPSTVEVQFMEAHSDVRWSYQDMQGWLHVDDEIERGAIGIARPPPLTSPTDPLDDSAITISGRVESLMLEDWIADGGDASVSLPIDWVIRDLAVRRFSAGDLVFDNLLLRGEQRGAEVSFVFDAPDIKGEARFGDQVPLELDLSYLAVPNSEDKTRVDEAFVELGLVEALEPRVAASVDPLDVELGRSLPEANVRIDELKVGSDAFGAWAFTISPQLNSPGESVLIEDLSADVNGVHVRDARLVWDLTKNRTEFAGRLELDDLAETLPQWDYAASMKTDTAMLNASVDWSGSPLNMTLLDLEGNVSFDANEGRFLDVQAGQGGLRILSLVNFANITKRISLDFSDVTGQGIEFRRIEGELRLAQGVVTFPERMLVDSPGSNFEFGGRVDLNNGILDNEMIVTLPVSESLPWYGVYVAAIVNPLAGLGVLIGQRMLRKPIEQFSSAKFSVKGTIDEPEVKFVSLWDKSMRDVTNMEAELSGEDATEKAAEGDQAEGSEQQNVGGIIRSKIAPSAEHEQSGGIKKEGSSRFVEQAETLFTRTTTP